MKLIHSKSKKEYLLASIIREEIIMQRRKVTFIDCQNRIDQYMFRRDEIEMIMDNLFLCRMDRFFDFLERLETIHDDPYFQKSHTLLISSWHTLMDGMDEDDRRFYLEKVDEAIQKIGREGGKEVVVLE